ncbi:cell division protein DivIVA [Mycobacterium asiaticum]|uniref:Cell division protein DivIVA n=1 Tax=Mycobacterium asiaticum TaxID=1790 RepID=A0A1A3NIN9_MYCAS|nr:DivIVA domain-containing protein [Mycobacterium asiaticum]OBK21666.1 cell division protein DivIVA [Mycobacterium asiaticum]
MIAEPAKVFSRTFRGYDPAAVDAHIEMLSTKQQLLHGDVESLRARLRESGDEAAALRKEVAVLVDTSPSPHAVQQRMAKMLRRAVEEASEMQAEARTEAEELIAAAEAEIETEQRKHQERLANMEEQRKALEAEMARMRADAEAAIEQAWQEALREQEQLVEQARRAVDEAAQRRIEILERLMAVYRDLEAVPAALESAYNEQNDQPESGSMSANVVRLDGKVSTA